MIGIMLLNHVRDLPNGIDSPPFPITAQNDKISLPHPKESLTSSRVTKAVMAKSCPSYHLHIQKENISRHTPY